MVSSLAHTAVKRTAISATVVAQCCQHFIDSNIEMPRLLLFYFYHEKYIKPGHLYEHLPSFIPIIPGN